MIQLEFQTLIYGISYNEMTTKFMKRSNLDNGWCSVKPINTIQSTNIKEKQKVALDEVELFICSSMPGSNKKVRKDY